MRCGLQVSYFSWPGAPASIGPTFGRIAQNAEAAGLSSLWVMDHYFQIEMIGPPELDMLEGYTALAYAAALTERFMARCEEALADRRAAALRAERGLPAVTLRIEHPTVEGWERGDHGCGQHDR